MALDPKQDEVSEAAAKLYAELEGQGVEVLYDDRKERPGVKFKDADLVGIPVRVVIGKRGLANGEMEISLRSDREKIMVPVADALGKVMELVGG